MAIFPSASEMRTIFSPIVADATVQLGSLADLHQMQTLRRPDGSYKEAPAFTEANVPVRFSMVTFEQAQSIFGEDSTVTVKASMSRIAFVIIKADDVFEVRTGDYAGQWLKVTRVIENALSDSYTLGLVKSEPLP